MAAKHNMKIPILCQKLFYFFEGSIFDILLKIQKLNYVKETYLIYEESDLMRY